MQLPSCGLPSALADKFKATNQYKGWVGLTLFSGVFNLVASRPTRSYASEESGSEYVDEEDFQPLADEHDK